MLIRSEKAIENNYIALMMCAFNRLVKLELVPDLLSTTLIRYLRRFIQKRDIPEAFMSDNTKIFKAKDLKTF